MEELLVEDSRAIWSYMDTCGRTQELLENEMDTLALVMLTH